MECDDISQEWVNQNEHLKQMSTPITQISFSFQKMQRSLSTQFKILSYMTQTKQHVNKLYKHPQQYNLNRYPSYLTFEATRVRLDSSPQDETVQNYINANFVSVEGRRVIATQGPLTSTFENFWKMVDQHPVTTVFMLCNFIQKKIPKCQRYFPHLQHNGGLMFLNDYQLRLIQEQIHPNYQRVKVRKIQLKNITSKATKIITQYQATDWQDGKSPKECQGIGWLLARFLQQLSQNRIPVVHCSAGAGRTGTFIAMALLKLQIETKQDLSIFEVVRKLREQRWGMIKNLTQYEYLYEFAQEKIMNLQTAMNSLSDDSDQQGVKRSNGTQIS